MEPPHPPPFRAHPPPSQARSPRLRPPSPPHRACPRGGAELPEGAGVDCRDPRPSRPAGRRGHRRADRGRAREPGGVRRAGVGRHPPGPGRRGAADGRGAPGPGPSGGRGPGPGASRADRAGDGAFRPRTPPRSVPTRGMRRSSGSGPRTSAWRTRSRPWPAWAESTAPAEPAEPAWDANLGEDFDDGTREAIRRAVQGVQAQSDAKTEALERQVASMRQQLGNHQKAAQAEAQSMQDMKLRQTEHGLRASLPGLRRGERLAVLRAVAGPDPRSDERHVVPRAARIGRSTWATWPARR